MKPRRLGEAALVAFALFASACGAGEGGIDNSERGDAPMGSTAPVDVQSVAGAAAPASVPESASGSEVTSVSEPAIAPDSGMLPPYPSGADQTAPFEVGAHIWFDSSVSIRLSTKMSYFAWGGSNASMSSSCRVFNRDAMRSYQLAMLAEVTLVPPEGGCLNDASYFAEATVFDADGSARTYYGDGCGLGPSDTMLPQGWIDHFPTEHSTSCPE